MTKPFEFLQSALASYEPFVGGVIEPIAGNGLRLRVRDGDLHVTLDATGVHVTERTAGENGCRTLLIPYLRDDGSGVSTQVTTGPVTRFQKGSEQVLVEVESPIERVIDEPTGDQNRRGFCGLLRVELREASDTIRYHLRRGD